MQDWTIDDDVNSLVEVVNIKVLRDVDVPHILDFERQKLKSRGLSEPEVELNSWESSWRTESLDFYLGSGWSFAKWQGVEGESTLLAYFLAQPLLFFRSMTQTLWIERLGYVQLEHAKDLFDVAFRLSREKHLQKLILKGENDLIQHLTDWEFSKIGEQMYEFKTSKIRG